MKIALPVWENRVAPVFDAADQWILCLADGKTWTLGAIKDFPSSSPERKVQELLDQEVSLLICGALPYRLERFLTESGCGVISFIAGDTDEVLQAWSENQLDNSRFSMPGCRRDGGRRKGRRHRRGNR